MDDELAYLTSYFNLADGRRDDTADTFRVDTDLKSSSSPDGQAFLYIVTEASAGTAGRRARRLAADTIAWVYGSHGDDAPAGRLKDALRSAHSAIAREFDGHVSVGVSVIAIEGDSVYLAQVAPSQVYVLHDGRLNGVSASADDSTFSRALGGSRQPKIMVFRDQIEIGDMLALTSTWFHNSADAAELRECFAAGTADDVTEALLDLAREHGARNATAIVIEAVAASEIDADDADVPGFMEQVDAAVQALAGVGRMVWSELRAVPPQSNGNGHAQRAEDLSPPLTEATSTATPTRQAATVTERPGTREQLTEEVPIVGPDTVAPEPEPRETTWVDNPTAEPFAGDAPEDEAWMSGSRPFRPSTPDLPADEPAFPTEPADEPDFWSEAPIEEAPVEEPAVEEAPRRAAPEPSLSEMEQINSRLQYGPDMEDVIPPVQAFPDTSTTQPERIYPTSKEIEAANKRPRRFGGISRPEIGTVIRPGMGELDLDRPAGRTAPPAVVWFGMAALSLLLLVAVYLYYQHRHHAVADPYPGMARAEIAAAQRASSAATQDADLTLAHRYILLAQAAGDSPADVAALKRQWQTVSDKLHNIDRIYNPVVVADFGKVANAQPSQIAVGPGVVYILDAGRKSVFSVALQSATGPSTSPTAASGPSEILQSGQLVSGGFTVGDPLLLSSDGAEALVLDDHNTLFRYSQGGNTATGLTAADPNENVPAMAVSDPDVYLLDTKNSQVWRYPDAVAGYNPAASAYFISNGPNLSKAVSLTFDKNDMYILKSDGTVVKYDFEANKQTFTSNLHTPIQKPVEIYTGPTLPYVWIADPTNARLVEFDKSGTYVRTYRSGTAGMDFHNLKNFAVGPAGNTLYVLVGSKVYDFPVAH